jgi:hypothetical protein
MKRIRRIIKEIISEIFDVIELPDNYEIINPDTNTIIYKFIYDDIIYGVKFGKIINIEGMIIQDEKIKDIISNSDRKYYISFGVMNSSGQISDGMNTNKHDAIKIISFVSAIIKEFIKNKDADIISYFSDNDRNSVYKYIYNKFLKNDFLYYTAKEKKYYDRFLIKKDLLK